MCGNTTPTNLIAAPRTSRPSTDGPGPGSTLTCGFAGLMLPRRTDHRRTNPRASGTRAARSRDSGTWSRPRAYTTHPSRPCSRRVHLAHRSGTRAAALRSGPPSRSRVRALIVSIIVDPIALSGSSPYSGTGEHRVHPVHGQANVICGSACYTRRRPTRSRASNRMRWFRGTPGTSCRWSLGEPSHSVLGSHSAKFPAAIDTRVAGLHTPIDLTCQPQSRLGSATYVSDACLEAANELVRAGKRSCTGTASASWIGQPPCTVPRIENFTLMPNALLRARMHAETRWRQA